MTDETHEHFHGDEPPPFGGSWRALYVAVFVNLFVLIALFHLFTRHFG